MAPSPAALSKSCAYGRPDVAASAAAVFGVLDLLEEIATAPETRDRTHRARKSAEAALRECRLTYRDINDAAECPRRNLAWDGAKLVLHGIADPARGQGEAVGELRQFPERPRPTA